MIYREGRKERKGEEGLLSKYLPLSFAAFACFAVNLEPPNMAGAAKNEDMAQPMFYCVRRSKSDFAGGV